MQTTRPRYHDHWDLSAFIWDGTYNSIFGELWNQNEEDELGLLPEDLEEEATYIFDQWDGTYATAPTVYAPGYGWLTI